MISIGSALVSVYSKEGLEPLVREMHRKGIRLISTGGTQKFIQDLGIPVTGVEEITGYPGILGGRVKTLHPGIFGAILQRRNNPSDKNETEKYNIPSIDLVVVDLYPFTETLRSGADHDAVIEKIDIGGVSLIRAASKNHRDVLIIPSREDYTILEQVLDGKVEVSESLCRQMAARAFSLTAEYDREIGSYLAGGTSGNKELRYGENPHQKGSFEGELSSLFEQLNGKELSYNNLLDIDAAVNLIDEFKKPAVAILKHNNPCGLAENETISEAWKRALEGDPVSAFGGVIIANGKIDAATAQEIGKIFCEVVIAPDFDPEGLEILRQKKNRIILRRKQTSMPQMLRRTVLNGVLVQEKDNISETEADLKVVTKVAPSPEQIKDLLFANRIVKHGRSNAIVLAKDKQLTGSGVGQTSRVDALKQAVEKANSFNFELEGAVMASDAFFPFPDCVEIAGNAGVKAIIQPGGSIKDQESIDTCDRLGIAMVFTGYRHFRH